jgi:four helix bundle protein
VRGEKRAVSSEPIAGNEKPHRRLRVWQESVEFVVELYDEIAKFPDHEKFGLAAQLQRAAVSIPSNLAEGAARKNKKELSHFLYLARGSVSEIDTQLEIAYRLGYLTGAAYARLQGRLENVSKMLFGLIDSVSSRRAP